MTFDNRGLLLTHLSRGSGVCLMNIVLRMQPMDLVILVAEKAAESVACAAKSASGLSKHHADSPPVRSFGPLWPVLDTHGVRVLTTDNKHPFGPQQRKYERPCFPECDCDACVLPFHRLSGNDVSVR